MKIGYTSGVFDLFHVGHLNLLEKAKANCDYLIVGVCSDRLALDLKGKLPVINMVDRIRVVKSLKCVDRVVVESVDNKLLFWNALKFNIIFKGSDWKGTAKWVGLQKQFKDLGVEVKFFPYTKKISSSLLRGKLGA